MIISVTEGDDKPEEYPLMFQVSSVLLLNKLDLLPHLDFDMGRFQQDALKIITLSCKTGEGLDAWFRWLEERTS
ncbi:MAG: hypothetical protein JSW12_11135 [Deltaproteobacteria bacterium]|nr:MAG: hypothetical protein JSW12_11135 [Deltaproteobacteria bacterium]